MCSVWGSFWHRCLFKYKGKRYKYCVRCGREDLFENKLDKYRK